MPTSLSNYQKKQVEKISINAGLSLGVKNGIIKGDMVLTSDGPKVIEIATRLSGGYFSSDQIKLNTGVNIVKYAINIATGTKFDINNLIPRFNKGVAIRYFFPKPGKIINIKNLDFIKSQKYIHKFKLFVKVGDEIKNVTDHTKRSGFVITTGKDKEDAISNAKKVIDKVIIETI